jgi:hypothetical protein
MNDQRSVGQVVPGCDVRYAVEDERPAGIEKDFRVIGEQRPGAETAAGGQPAESIG